MNTAWLKPRTVYLLSACFGAHHLVKSDLPIPTVHGHQVNMSIIVQKICTAWELPVHKSIYIPCQGSFILPPERNRTSFLMWIWIEILLTLSSLLMKEWWVDFCQLTRCKCGLEITDAARMCSWECRACLRHSHVSCSCFLQIQDSIVGDNSQVQHGSGKEMGSKPNEPNLGKWKEEKLKGGNKRIRVEAYLYFCKIEGIIMLQKPIRKTGWSLCLPDTSLVISPFFFFLVKAIRNQSSVKNLGIINMHMMLLITYWLFLRITVSQIILDYPDFSLCFTCVGLFLASADPTTQFSTGQKSSVVLKKKNVLRVGFHDVDL